MKRHQKQDFDRPEINVTNSEISWAEKRENSLKFCDLLVLRARKKES
jgi:hypothetical protein